MQGNPERKAASNTNEVVLVCKEWADISVQIHKAHTETPKTPAAVNTVERAEGSKYIFARFCTFVSCLNEKFGIFGGFIFVHAVTPYPLTFPIFTPQPLQVY